MGGSSKTYPAKGESKGGVHKPSGSAGKSSVVREESGHLSEGDHDEVDDHALKNTKGGRQCGVRL